MTTDSLAPLARDEMVSVIEGRAVDTRVPVMIHFWLKSEDSDWGRSADAIMARYTEDVQAIQFQVPKVYDAPADEPSYRWLSHDALPNAGEGALDAQAGIADWSELDAVLADFPDPMSPHLLPNNPEPDGRYRLGYWWYGLFERHWSLRGMENSLLDFHSNPVEVKQLYRALTDFYLVAIERARSELGIDGVFFSDDLGAQQGPMFSPKILREFFLPYYREMIDRAHSLGMHVWLHCCGNISPFVGDLIDAGLDVLHPIQKYTMDEQEVAREIDGRLCVWAGFDVQRIIPWGTPDEVRREVRYLVDTFGDPRGGLILGVGNALHSDCPLASLEALMDEAYCYRPERGAG